MQTTTKGVSLSSTGPWSGERRKLIGGGLRKGLLNTSVFRPLEERLTNVRISALAESLIRQFRTFWTFVWRFRVRFGSRKRLAIADRSEGFFRRLEEIFEQHAVLIEFDLLDFLSVDSFEFYWLSVSWQFWVFYDFGGETFDFNCKVAFRVVGFWVRVSSSHWYGHGTGPLEGLEIGSLMLDDSTLSGVCKKP